MVHYIDVAHWLLDLEHPTEAVTVGDNFMTRGLWETPDTIQTLIRFQEKEVQVYFEGTFINARNRAMLEFMGTEATLYLDRGRYEIHPEPNRKIPYSEMVLGDGSRGRDFYQNPPGTILHLKNWADCIRSRQQPLAPAEIGVQAAEGAHLGNIAYRQERLARWQS